MTTGFKMWQNKKIDSLGDICNSKWDYSRSADHTVLYIPGMLILCIVIFNQDSVINANR